MKPYTASLFVSASAGTDPSGVDKERIVDAARGYAEGWDFGDVSRVASMAHPQWSKKCVRLTDAGGFFLESWGAQKMLRWIPSKEHEAELTDERIDINVLDHSGTIAAAKVEWVKSCGVVYEVDPSVGRVVQAVRACSSGSLTSCSPVVSTACARVRTSSPR